MSFSFTYHLAYSQNQKSNVLLNIGVDSALTWWLIWGCFSTKHLPEQLNDRPEIWLGREWLADPTDRDFRVADLLCSQ